MTSAETVENVDRRLRIIAPQLTGVNQTAGWRVAANDAGELVTRLLESVSSAIGKQSRLDLRIGTGKTAVGCESKLFPVDEQLASNHAEIWPPRGHYESQANAP